MRKDINGIIRYTCGHTKPDDTNRNSLCISINIYNYNKMKEFVYFFVKDNSKVKDHEVHPGRHI